MPLPGSPGLNDWLFATLGARTACVQACVPTHTHRSSRGCSAKGGDADVPVIVDSVVELLAEPPTSPARPMAWHQLGWKANALYGRGSGRSMGRSGLGGRTTAGRGSRGTGARGGRRQ